MYPYGRQCIEEDDIAAVADALRGEFLTTGPKVAEFEAAFAERVGAKHAVVVSNGTTALHLAALAVGLGEGDAAIVPSLTFLATANAVRYCGAEVIFADVNPETGLMEAGHLEQALRRVPAGLKAKAVLPVHLAGQMVDLEALRSVADAHNLSIIADSCHALGSIYQASDGSRTTAGSCAYEDLSAFSFHPVKTIAMGEGGAITTNDPQQASRMRTLRSHGMVHRPVGPTFPDLGLDEEGNPNPWFYEMPELGFNYRAPDILCALGLSQLKKLDRFLAARARLVALYDEKLKSLAPYVLPPEKSAKSIPGWHLYAARLDFNAIGKSRARIMNDLREKGVGTQVHYLPVHHQPYYTNRYGHQPLPGADRYYASTLSLPLFPSMNGDDVRCIVDILASEIGR